MAITEFDESDTEDEPVIASFQVTALTLLPGDRLVPTGRVVDSAEPSGVGVTVNWTDGVTGDSGSAFWKRDQRVTVERAVFAGSEDAL